MWFRKLKRKMRFNPRRSFMIMFLLLFIFSFGIGYALIATNLSIDGTVDLDNSKWDIHFDNIQVASGSVSADTPTITNDTTISFSALLDNPGNYYEFTVDVVNDGTMNAEIDSIAILPVLTAEQQEFFDYTVTYVNGASIEEGDLLLADSFKTIKITARYKENTDISLYPTADQTFDFSVSLHYVQMSSVPDSKTVSFSVVGVDADPTTKGYLMYENGYVEELENGEILSLPVPIKVQYYILSDDEYLLLVNDSTFNEHSVLLIIDEDTELEIQLGEILESVSYRFVFERYDYYGERLKYSNTCTGTGIKQLSELFSECSDPEFNNPANYLTKPTKCTYLTYYPTSGSATIITDYTLFAVSTDEGYYSCYYSDCLSGDTEVEVYDKKKKKRKRKKLRDVGPDDLILCWDFEKGEFTFAQPLWIKKMNIDDFYYLLKFSDGSSLKVIGDHKVFDVDRNKFVNAGMENELQIGSHVYNSKGEVVELVSYDRVTEKIDSYSVITDYHMNLFANGILTSCVFSNIYPIENMKYVKEKLDRLTDEEFEGIAEEYIQGLRLREVPSNFRGDKETTISYIHEYVNNLINKKEI